MDRSPPEFVNAHILSPVVTGIGDGEIRDSDMPKGTFTREEIGDRVRQARSFAGLSEATLDQVLRSGHVRKVAQGQILVHQGDQPQNLYVVLEGRLKASLASEEGSEMALRVVVPGNSCMAAILFTGHPSPVTVQALDDVTLWALPATFVKKLVLDSSEFAGNMLTIAVSRYRTSIDHIHALALKTPLQRIGHYLLCEHISHGATDLTFELPYRKSVLASHLGMTPETLSRSFARVRDLGIRIDGQNVRLRDAFALCHFCDLNAGETCPIADRESCPQCRV